MPKPISRTSATCILKDPDTGEKVHIQHGGSILIVEAAHSGGRVEICGPAMIEAVGYAIEDLCASVDDPACYRGDDRHKPGAPIRGDGTEQRTEPRLFTALEDGLRVDKIAHARCAAWLDTHFVLLETYTQ